MTKNPLPFIDHILESIDAIEAYLKKTSKKEFLTDFSASQDILIRDGILYRFMIIGEAVKRLPESFQNTYSKIPWAKMAGFRDVVIHQYDGLDFEIVWTIAHKDLSYLKKQIQKVKKDLEQQMKTL